MTILLGFTVQTDHFITAIRSDVIDIDKEHCGCQIIDFTIHFTLSVVNKEVEKIVQADHFITAGKPDVIATDNKHYECACKYVYKYVGIY